MMMALTTVLTTSGLLSAFHTSVEGVSALFHVSFNCWVYVNFHVSRLICKCIKLMPRTDLQENCIEFLAERRLLALLNKKGDHISNEFFDGAALVVCRLKALTTEEQLVLNANKGKVCRVDTAMFHDKVMIICNSVCWSAPQEVWATTHRRFSAFTHFSLR